MTKKICKIIKKEVETFSDKIENLQGKILFLTKLKKYTEILQEIYWKFRRKILFLTKLKKYNESVEIEEFVRK